MLVDFLYILVTLSYLIIAESPFKRKSPRTLTYISLSLNLDVVKEFDLRPAAITTTQEPSASKVTQWYHFSLKFEQWNYFIMYQL